MREVLFTLSLFGREIPFYAYGFFFGLGCFFGGQMCAFMASKDGVPSERTWKFTLGVIICGLIGGRLHALAVDDTLQGAAALGERGFTYYGAALSGILGAIPVSALLGIKPFTMMWDAAAPSLPLAHAFGRMGCHLAGCCYGQPATGFWAPFGVSYPPGSTPFSDQCTAGAIAKTAPGSLPLVPVPLIEMSLELVQALAISLYVIKRRPRFGQGMLVYVVGYGVIRIIMETVRGDPGRGKLFGLSTSTSIGVVTIAIAGALAWFPPLARLRSARPERAAG